MSIKELELTQKAITEYISALLNNNNPLTGEIIQNDFLTTPELKNELQFVRDNYLYPHINVVKAIIARSEMYIKPAQLNQLTPTNDSITLYNLISAILQISKTNRTISIHSRDILDWLKYEQLITLTESYIAEVTPKGAEIGLSVDKKNAQLFFTPSAQEYVYQNIQQLFDYKNQHCYHPGRNYGTEYYAQVYSLAFNISKQYVNIHESHLTFFKKLSGSIDPYTNQPVKSDSLLQNPKILSFIKYIGEILEFQSSAFECVLSGKIASKKEPSKSMMEKIQSIKNQFLPAFYITNQQKEKLSVLEQNCSCTDFKNTLAFAASENGTRQLKTTDILNWLLKMELIAYNEQHRTYPTENGKNVGIIETNDEKSSMLLSPKAQQFVIDNIDAIVFTAMHCNNT